MRLSKMKLRDSHRLFRLGFLLLIGALAARPVAAQTLLAWPSDTGDVTRYNTPEECLAASERVRSAVDGWGPVWEDTLPLTPSQAMAPLPAAVIQTAKRCGARFAAQTAPVTDFAPLLHLYLLAGQDADASIIIHRRLAAVQPTALRERVAVLDSALAGYLWIAFGDLQMRAQPVRLAVAESLLVEVGGFPDSLRAIEQRMTPAFQLLRAAKNAGDTAMVRRVAQRYLAIVSRATPADRRAGFYETYAALTSYIAMVMRDESALLDSLRHGTKGYVNMKRAAWAKASGERPDALKFPIGEPAPAIEATTWFGRGNADSPRPTKGKLGLVVYLDYQCRWYGGSRCFPAYAAVRRLAARYPSLEVTLIARTHGYFSKMAPPTPAEEATALREWWQQFHRMPGALAVTATDFWRLDDPDRRRIDRPTANETQYSFGRSWELEPGMAFLVDRDGTILEVGGLGTKDSMGTPDVEEQLAQLIEIELQPQSASR